jgi:CRISPR-associated endonuclease/helicase Cas3
MSASLSTRFNAPERAPNEPAALAAIWAKSADKGAGGAPESLVQHTWSVLSQLAQRIRLRPELPNLVDMPRLWHVLYWSAWLHDFGKAAHGFQARLRGGVRWPHRHEVLSLAFVPWISAGLLVSERDWLIATIASHHRDCDVIKPAYNRVGDPNGETLATLVASINDATVGALWDWLNACALPWRSVLGLETYVDPVTLLDRDEAVRVFRNDGASVIRRGLTRWQRMTEDDLPIAAPETRQHSQSILLRGHLISADHTASAHVGDLPPAHFPSSDSLARLLKLDQPFEHQIEARDADGSLVLMAPTGSGKTEAALLWAMAQSHIDRPLARLFYHLPFQASMNAMLDRLQNAEPQPHGRAALFPGRVSLEHSKSVLALYRRFQIDGDDDQQSAARRAKHAKNLARLHMYPVRILTPYQLLKAPYRLHGYETLLTDCAQSAHIFDEIHAFEPERLALILATIKHLREHYGARCLLMSATLPALLRSRVADAIGTPRIVRASAALYASFRRHRLQMRDGEVLDGAVLEEIAAHARDGASVLVCCNTVGRAQQAYKALTSRMGQDASVILLHGKFTMRDRLEKEALVRSATGSRSSKRRPIVLVATQVVEVSLDIDLDMLYSDPAPLEALIQRFGRINRRRLIEGGAPVRVFRRPDDGQKIYDPILVGAGLSVLEAHDGELIDEARVSDMLDMVYAEPDIATAWTKRYESAYVAFERGMLTQLFAFQSSPQLEAQFYQAFDGIEVLAVALQSEHDALRDEAPLLASELMVTLRWGQYQALKRKGWIIETEAEKGYPPVAMCHYDSEHGLNPAIKHDGEPAQVALDDSI